MRVPTIPVLLLIGCAAGTARAGETGCDLEQGDPVGIAQVIDAETVRLADERTVKLVGLLAPKAPAWWKGEKAWGFAERAKEALEALLRGRQVRLGLSGRERDRRGRLLAHLFVADGPERLWVQGRMIELGHGRAWSLPNNRACARALLAREARARAARAGLWRGRYYAVLPAAETEVLLKRRYSFQIVEGRVVSVAKLRSWTFVNFGADYRSDFTIAVRAGDRGAFANSDAPLESLEGKRIRVRGWIERWNGPVIKATHPEQIELAESPAETGEGADKGGQGEKNPAPLARTPGSMDL